MTPGSSTPDARRVGRDRLARRRSASARLAGVGQAREDLRERAGEGRRPRPPLLERAGAERRRKLVDAHVLQAGAGEQRRQLLGVAERERRGHARRRHRLADLLAHGVEHEPEPGVALARAPHRDRRAAAGPQHTDDLARGGRGVGREHEALAAEHGVVGAVGLRDVLDVERERAHVGEAERARARAAAIAVISAATSDRTTSPPGCDERAPRPGPRRPARRPARARARPACGRTRSSIAAVMPAPRSST